MLDGLLYITVFKILSEFSHVSIRDIMLVQHTIPWLKHKFHIHVVYWSLEHLRFYKHSIRPYDAFCMVVVCCSCLLSRKPGWSLLAVLFIIMHVMATTIYWIVSCRAQCYYYSTNVITFQYISYAWWDLNPQSLD